MLEIFHHLKSSHVWFFETMVLEKFNPLPVTILAQAPPRAITASCHPPSVATCCLLLTAHHSLSPTLPPSLLTHPKPCAIQGYSMDRLETLTSLRKCFKHYFRFLMKTGSRAKSLSGGWCMFPNDRGLPCPWEGLIG